MMELPANDSNLEFLRRHHIKYCIRSLGVLPERCQTLDSTRVVMAFFAVSCLDLLQALDEIENDRKSIIDWLYSLQVQPKGNEEGIIDYGFRGSSTCIAGVENSELCEKAHISVTYTALSTLIILGDDLSRVDKKNILLSLKHLQLPNGSFRPINFDCESDMRFLYCAACICYILKDWSYIDVEKAVEYIKHSLNYDGGIGQGPGLESHGGPTYCAIAALSLMGRLDSTFSDLQMKQLRRWLLFRQKKAFHGRPNKPDDSCYTFWIGASLKILDLYKFINYNELVNYVLNAQDSITGGIGKWDDSGTDLMHTYLAISGLLLPGKCVPLVHPGLNISHRAATFLHELHKQWNLTN